MTAFFDVLLKDPRSRIVKLDLKSQPRISVRETIGTYLKFSRERTEVVLDLVEQTRFIVLRDLEEKYQLHVTLVEEEKKDLKKVFGLETWDAKTHEMTSVDLTLDEDALRIRICQVSPITEAQLEGLLDILELGGNVSLRYTDSSERHMIMRVTFRIALDG